MERLQGPINPCFFGKENLDVECLEQETTKTLGFSCYEEFVSADHSLSFKEEAAAAGQPRRLTGNRSLEDKMPLLERLQTVELPRFSPLCELSFQASLSSQQYCKNPWDQNHGNIYTPKLMVFSGRFQAPEHPESCLTHEGLEMQHSPVKSETKDLHQHSPVKSHETKSNHQHPHSTCACAADGASSKCNQEQPNPVDRQYYCCGQGKKSKGAIGRPRESGLTIYPAAAAVNKEKRKRIKRRRSAKNKEEVESQRMTHIAVERNRRRQMNDHLCALRSIIPSYYIQRGDQASIIGGAIDFVKELEQLLQSLQAQKRMRKSELVLDQGALSSTSSSTATVSLNGMFAAASSPTSQYRNTNSEGGGNCTVSIVRGSHEFTAEKKSVVVDVKVRVSQKQVNLKVEYYCPGKEGRGQGQLLKAIVALEDLRLTVLHLNITSLETSVHYSFNLKIEDDCELGSADGIAVAVHQIFSFINGNT